ncbi:MAG TPA: twitching motility protein PilT [Prolixibacteraceae bacterium]|jgi:uncharacterized protein with PIN domain/molybdopterin converting factor small subunit|nr:twitching motility protein PilT [Prolixibacteraceae bacterium]
MIQVSFRFYEELNNYLPEELRQVWVESNIETKASIGEIIQSLGIPPDEIDLVLVNQQSKSLDYLLQDGDRVSIFPVFESFDLSEMNQLREKPLRNPSFILDVHLGRLCKYLRMLGWDTLYSNQYTPEQMIELSLQEKRILLSRSIQLTRHKQLTHAWWVRSSNPLEQLKDLVTRLDLSSQADPLTRCLNCNNKLISIDKTEVVGRLEDRTAKYYSEFFVCRKCDQIYWKGSHYENMVKFIEQHLQTVN